MHRALGTENPIEETQLFPLIMRKESIKCGGKGQMDACDEDLIKTMNSSTTTF